MKNIPEDERWLFEDPEALRGVQEGLKQAAERTFAPGPSTEELKKLADQFSDEPSEEEKP